MPRSALAAVFKGRPVRDLARDVLAIARRGLASRGLGEERYIDELDEIAQSGARPSFLSCLGRGTVLWALYREAPALSGERFSFPGGGRVLNLQTGFGGAASPENRPPLRPPLPHTLCLYRL